MSLVQGVDGALYGTTSTGGAHKSGSVFKRWLSGGMSVLYSFCAQTNCTDGKTPYAGLILGTDGNFYGTTYSGGAHQGGTVFKISPTGALTTLYSFCSSASCADGSNSNAPLLQASDGNFYGTTFAGGLAAVGGFPDTNGSRPAGSVVQATDGNFYGATTYGGPSTACSGNGCGTIFSLSVGLGPFVKTVPTSAKMGTAVTIVGTSLTGVSSVSFNGTPAAFTVVSRFQIKTTVPSGATSGFVTVTTSNGTLQSNVVFRVLP